MHTSKSRVLVVDDETINIEAIFEILQDEYEILIATSGKQALSTAHCIRPDLILLDVMMPDMDGYETCAQLRKGPDTSTIPVIFVTTQSAIEQEVKGFETGAVDYVTRPLRPKALLARVRTHINKKIHSLAQAPVSDVPLNGLSAREHEILRWLQCGKTNWEIAQIIGTSQDNVKYFISKLMTRFSVYSRMQLSMRAMELQMAATQQAPSSINTSRKHAE